MFSSSKNYFIGPPDDDMTWRSGKGLSTMSRFGLSNPYLNQSLAGAGKFSELTPHQRAALYWPGIQGLISNPAVWRDRFVLNSKYILKI